MVPKQLPSHSISDGLKLISFCPLCETSYNPIEARVLGEREDQHLLHIQCRKCSNSIIALVMVAPNGVSSVGLITDLTFDDVVRFREGDGVTADDVLAAHEALQNEQAFFEALA